MRQVMSNACSQVKPHSSRRMRINSGMASVGCVSLIWMATLSGRLSSVAYCERCVFTMSLMDALERKYCWRRRRILPSMWLSFGYSTLEISSALAFLAMALPYWPALKLLMSKSGALARHRRSFETPALSYPATNISLGTASTLE